MADRIEAGRELQAARVAFAAAGSPRSRADAMSRRNYIRDLTRRAGGKQRARKASAADLERLGILHIDRTKKGAGDG